MLNLKVTKKPRREALKNKVIIKRVSNISINQVHNESNKFSNISKNTLQKISRNFKLKEKYYTNEKIYSLKVNKKVEDPNKL